MFRISLILVFSGAFLSASFCRAQTKSTSRPGVFRAAINGPLPTTPGDHKLRFRTKVGSKTINMAFLLHLPDDYGTAGHRSPMLVFFHGLGECGTDLGAIMQLGPMAKISADPVFAHSCPLIILSPQCPPRGQRWEDRDMNQAVVDLVHRILREMHVDPDRIYATGFSMGGAGTWATALYAPDMFAAISPISAIAWKPELASHRLEFASIWNICGDNDRDRYKDGTEQMKLAFAGDVADDRFTLLLGNGHDAWFPAYDRPQFYEWLLAHRRPTTTEREMLKQHHACPDWPLPSARGVSLNRWPTRIGDQPYDLYYTVYTPVGYAPTGKPVALTLFLDDSGTIGPDIYGLCPHGPDRALLTAPNDSLANHVPMVIVSPRLPIKNQWDSPGMKSVLLGLIDHVAGEINIDRSRTTVCGQNAGAIAALNLAQSAKGRFVGAAVVIKDKQAALPPLAAGLPVNLYVSYASLAAKVSHESNGSDHRVIKIATQSNPFEDADFYAWLANQHRSSGTPAVAH